MSFNDPMILTFQLFGSMIPKTFLALTLKSGGQDTLIRLNGEKDRSEPEPSKKFK